LRCKCFIKNKKIKNLLQGLRPYSPLLNSLNINVKKSVKFSKIYTK
jgi:hypothetical protein